MTGPEHYREAEDLLCQPWEDAAHAQLFIAQAQVHATLADAAARALHSGGDEMYADDKAAWVTAASEEGKREAS